MPSHFGLCFFIGNVDAGLVKIGFSRNVTGRLNRPRSDSLFRLSILAVINGAGDRERYYHDKFAASRFSGEWFEVTPEILSEIDAINSRQNQNGPEMRSNAPRPRIANGGSQWLIRPIITLLTFWNLSAAINACGKAMRPI